LTYFRATILAARGSVSEQILTCVDKFDEAPPRGRIRQ
jgi:hypothetical protein